MAVKRLITFAGERPTPDALLAQLREIDPLLELICVGKRWWLGSVQDNKYRREIGEFIKKVELGRDVPNVENLLLADLSFEGFALIETYEPLAGDPAGPCKDASGNIVTIVEDMRERDYHWKLDQGKQVFWEKFTGREQKRQAENDRILRDKMLTDGRAAWRKARRQSVSVTNIGITA